MALRLPVNDMMLIAFGNEYHYADDNETNLLQI